jgi:Rrf2 family nitric oxide-sensitive transcriptional repressor
LQSLIQAGFVRTIRGYGGGIELACEPAEITIRQIVESVEGRQQLYDCDSRNIDCSNKANCLLRDVLERAGGAMLGVLESTTLADLVPETLAEAELVASSN